MRPLSTSDILGEATKLFAQSHEDFIFVFDGFCSIGGLDQRGLMIRWGAVEGQQTVEEGDKLVSGALRSKGQSNGRKAMDGIQAKEDVIVLDGREQDVSIGSQTRP